MQDTVHRPITDPQTYGWICTYSSMLQLFAWKSHTFTTRPSSAKLIVWSKKGHRTLVKRHSISTTMRWGAVEHGCTWQGYQADNAHRLMVSFRSLQPCGPHRCVNRVVTLRDRNMQRLGTIHKHEEPQKWYWRPRIQRVKGLWWKKKISNDIWNKC